mmetsp:Transcript_24810/g.50357  ORF Transcript_24810/g.50357 Transcript_24810/m.50357 type:complete len:218 (+) Transcript_24810:155-808(+)
MGDDGEDAAESSQPVSSQLSLHEQLFGSQDPNAADVKAMLEKCPGCLELELWRTASRQSFEGIYADDDASESAGSSAGPSAASFSRRFVPKKRHLGRCPKKPKRSSLRQANLGSWSDICGHGQNAEKQLVKLLGSHAFFFGALAQDLAWKKIQKKQEKKKAAEKAAEKKKKEKASEEEEEEEEGAARESAERVPMDPEQTGQGDVATVFTQFGEHDA